MKTFLLITVLVLALVLVVLEGLLQLEAARPGILKYVAKRMLVHQQPPQESEAP